MNIPLIPDARDQLTIAHERGEQLRSAASANGLGRPHGPRRLLASSLRRFADRLDPAPLWREALR